MHYTVYAIILYIVYIARHPYYSVASILLPLPTGVPAVGWLRVVYVSFLFSNICYIYIYVLLYYIYNVLILYTILYIYIYILCVIMSIYHIYVLYICYYAYITPLITPIYLTYTPIYLLFCPYGQICAILVYFTLS